MNVTFIKPGAKNSVLRATSTEVSEGARTESSRPALSFTESGPASVKKGRLQEQNILTG